MSQIGIADPDFDGIESSKRPRMIDTENTTADVDFTVEDGFMSEVEDDIQSIVAEEPVDSTPEDDTAPVQQFDTEESTSSEVQSHRADVAKCREDLTATIENFAVRMHHIVDQYKANLLESLVIMTEPIDEKISILDSELQQNAVLAEKLEKAKAVFASMSAQF